MEPMHMHRSSSTRSRIAVACLAASLASACGDDDATAGTDGITTASTSTTAGSTEASSDATSDATAGSDDSSGSASSSSDSDTVGTTDDPTTTTEPETTETTGPAACDFAPGCLTPQPPNPAAGLASHAPVGCGEGPFNYGGSAFLDDPPFGGGDFGVDAVKLVPHAADLDGDGTVEVVFNGRKLAGVNITPITGNGTLGAPTTLQGGIFAGGWGLDLGDVNGDGVLDIAVGDHNDGGLVWVSAGGGYSLAPGVDSPSMSGAGLGDLDGDGDLDLVLGSDQFNSGYAVFMNSGGAFSPAQVTGLPPYKGGGGSNIGQLGFADLDGDHDLDIVAFAISGGFQALVFANDGTGLGYSQMAQLQGGALQINGTPMHGALGDVNCDGLIDVAVGGYVHLNSGGAFTLGAAVNEAYLSQLADMNGDGFMDLITHSEEGGLALYAGDGTGTSWVEQDVGLPPADLLNPAPSSYYLDTPYGLDVVDVDGNGNLDIIRAYLAFDSMGFGTDSDRKNYLEVWVR